jgi:hypothetical protein
MASKITLYTKSVYTGEKNEISVDKSKITVRMDSTDPSLVQDSRVAPTQHNVNKGSDV